MKIRGSSDKRGKDRLGEQKNKAHRVKEPLERAPEARKGRPKGGQGEAQEAQKSLAGVQVP